jgi:opacity protein-like surface antigen
MSLRKSLLAATVLSLPLAANAQSWDPRVQGVYVGAGIGANYLSDQSETILGRSTDIGFDWGWVGVLSVGYGFGNGLRLEVEGSYRRNDVDTIKQAGRGSFRSLGGHAYSYGAMVNVLYDFNLGGVVPYVGAGAGYIVHGFDSVRGVASDGTRIALDGDEGNFAYQAIVGIGIPIDSVPGLALTAEYRFLGTVGHDISGTVTTIVGGPFAGAVTQRVTFSADNFNHSILLGVRYNFGRTAAPAPVPAAAPAPARTFLVFFDWNSAELTARARQIIAEAAQARTRQQVTRIEVNGHTDTSGSAAYNQGLSERRAAAVAAELVRLGVPRNEIVTRGFGESQLLVPTPDNTREPQNRRVEIILR